MVKIILANGVAGRRSFRAFSLSRKILYCNGVLVLILGLMSAVITAATIFVPQLFVFSSHPPAMYLIDIERQKYLFEYKSSIFVDSGLVRITEREGVEGPAGLQRGSFLPFLAPVHCDGIPPKYLQDRIRSIDSRIIGFSKKESGPQTVGIVFTGFPLRSAVVVYRVISWDGSHLQCDGAISAIHEFGPFSISGVVGWPLLQAGPIIINFLFFYLCALTLYVLKLFFRVHRRLRLGKCVWCGHVVSREGDAPVCCSECGNFS